MLNTLFANDVRQTLDQFRRSVDQMFENFYGQTLTTPANSAGAETDWTFTPPVEYGWNDDFLSLRAVLPGVGEKDVSVTVQNNQLIVQGERKAPPGINRNAFRQLTYGRFYAALNLPAGLDADHARCTLRNGVLDIEVPVLEASKPRQVRIETGEQNKAIAA